MEIDRTHQPARATWPWSTDTIMDAMRPYAPETRDLMLSTYRWCIDPKHPVSRQEFARRVGYDETTVYKFFLNKYTNPDTKEPQPPPEKFLKAVAEFLRLEMDRADGGKTVFVMTPTSKMIIQCFNLARESCTPAIIYGPSHIGKTWTSEYYQQGDSHGRTIYCRLPAATGLGGMVRAIAESLGISDKSNTMALIERIKRSLNKDTLLILDECHLLANTYRVGSFFLCIDTIRGIYDAVGCGMVLIWTRIDSLKQFSQRELQQVWRRGVHKLELPVCPTRGDLAAVTKHAGLEWPESGETATASVPGVNGGKPVSENLLEMLRHVARNDGLKAITERIRYGKKLAKQGGETFAWRHFLIAHLMIKAQSEPKATGWE